MKKYRTTLLIWLSLIIGEAHTFFENSTKTANWVYKGNATMSLQWNVKLAGDELMWLLVALAFLFYEKNRTNLTTVRVFVIYSVADLFFYFYNFKQKEGGYGWIYLIVLVTWIKLYNYESGRAAKRQRAIAQT